MTLVAATQPSLGRSIVACPAGQRATGGGGFVTSAADAYLFDSSPPTTVQPPTAWEAQAALVAGGAPAEVQAYVICAAPVTAVTPHLRLRLVPVACRPAHASGPAPIVRIRHITHFLLLAASAQ